MRYLAYKKRLITKSRDYFLIDGLLFSLILGVIGSRLSYILLYNILFSIEPLAGISLFSSGFTFFGGLISGLAAFLYWIRHEENKLLWLDLIIIGVVFGMGISEIGGFLNDGLITHLTGFVGSFALSGLMYLRLVTERKAGHTFWLGIFLLVLLIFFLGFWRIEKIFWIGLNLTQLVSLIAMIPLGYFAAKTIKVSQ